jgi:signal transduction histidine kinase
MQIRTKINLYFITITASLLLISFISIYFFTLNDRQREFRKHILSKATTRAIYRIKVKSINPELLKTLDYHKKDLLDKENISIYDEGNHKIYSNNYAYHFKHIIPEFQKKIEYIRNVKQTYYTYHQLEIVGKLYPYAGKNYVLLVGAKDSIGIKQLADLRKNLFYIFIGILTFIGLAGWIFSKKILDPISKVMNQVDEISVANLSQRLTEKKGKKDEITRLIHTFNELLDRLEKAFQIQRAFISHASHELINPLTSISSQIEVSLLNTRTEEEYQTILSSILEDIQRLNSISHQLIKLSKFSNIKNKVGFKMIRFDELIWQIRKEYLEKYPESIIQLRIEHLPDEIEKLEIYGNETLLQTCINNLIENGLKYSFENKLELCIDFRNNQIILDVINQGEGIHKKDLMHIFTPFYRTKQSTGIKGYGIGLSIVKTILDLHQASINVKSIPNEKTTFSILFKTI